MRTLQMHCSKYADAKCIAVGVMTLDI
jgi:hypothetical protein